MRVARAETLRKVQEIRSLFMELGEEIGESVLNMDVSEEQCEYVRMGLSEDDCVLEVSSQREVATGRGWTYVSNYPVPVSNLRSGSLITDWLEWATKNKRSVRPAVLEWILMDPDRAEGFVRNLSTYPEFRKKFGGLYTTILAALERLGGPSMNTPEFLV